MFQNGEPLLHPEFAKIVKYAKDNSSTKWIDITTNGLCLKPDLNRDIVDAGLDKIIISVNGLSSEQYEFYTRTRIDFEKYVQNIRDLYEHKKNLQITIKGMYETFSAEERKRFFEIFQPICDEIIWEHTVPLWNGFSIDKTIESAKAIGVGDNLFVEKSICPEIFYIMHINSDGTVIPCCSDWRHSIILGDVKKQTLQEIWFGELFNKMRYEHVANGKNAVGGCKNCQWMSYAKIDNLDPYKGEILNRMSVDPLYKPFFNK